MVQYRRNKIKGGTYFFTVTLRNRQANLLTQHINLLRSCFKQVNQENAYKTLAIVVLPEHLHTIWKLPDEDDDYSMRWRKIKSYFSRGLQKNGVLISKNKHGECSIWQRRFWEHTIKDEIDLAKHVDYIHYNPVKHGLVKNVKDWPYSSFHRYVHLGFLNDDWAENGVKDIAAKYIEQVLIKRNQTI